MIYFIHIQKNIRFFHYSTAYRRNNSRIQTNLQSIRKTAFVTVKFMIKYYYIVVLFSVCPTVCRDGSMIRFCTQKGENA